MATLHEYLDAQAERLFLESPDNHTFVRALRHAAHCAQTSLAAAQNTAAQRAHILEVEERHWDEAIHAEVLTDADVDAVDTRLSALGDALTSAQEGIGVFKGWPVL